MGAAALADSEGKANDRKFIEEMRGYASSLVQAVKSSTAEYKHDNMTREPCPQCGKYLLEVNGKKGKMLVCRIETAATARAYP